MEQWEVLDGGKKRPAVRRQKKALEVLRVVMLVVVMLCSGAVGARICRAVALPTRVAAVGSWRLPCRCVCLAFGAAGPGARALPHCTST